MKEDERCCDGSRMQLQRKIVGGRSSGVGRRKAVGRRLDSGKVEKVTDIHGGEADGIQENSAIELN